MYASSGSTASSIDEIEDFRFVNGVNGMVFLFCIVSSLGISIKIGSFGGMCVRERVLLLFETF